jgi:hypothetical protein
MPRECMYIRRLSVKVESQLCQSVSVGPKAIAFPELEAVFGLLGLVKDVVIETYVDSR